MGCTCLAKITTDHASVSPKKRKHTLVHTCTLQCDARTRDKQRLALSAMRKT